MNIRLSDLNGLPVFDRENHKFRGYVRRSVLTTDRTAIRALILRRQPFYPHMIMAFDRLYGIADDHLMSIGPAVPMIISREITRDFKNAMTKPNPTAAEDGAVIGKVVDYIVDETGEVTSLILEKNIITKPVMIGADQVIEFKNGVFYMKPGTSRWERTPLFEDIAVLTARKLAFATNKTKSAIARVKKKYKES